jgi:hypothetical protein
MEKNETLWRDQVKSWRKEWGKEVAVHQAFLWITPSTLQDGKLVLLFSRGQTQVQQTFVKQTTPWKDLFNERIGSQATSTGRLASLHLTINGMMSS